MRYWLVSYQTKDNKYYTEIIFAKNFDDAKSYAYFKPYRRNKSDLINTIKEIVD